MKVSCIYKISSLLYPDRVYIGSTSNYKKRVRQHRIDLSANKHNNSKMQRHFNKYGINDFIAEIVELVPCNNLLTKEQYFINTLIPYFNLCKIAGSRLGVKNKNTVSVKKYDLYGNLLMTYRTIKDARESEGINIRVYSKKNKTIGGFVWVKDGEKLPDFNIINKELIEHKECKMKPVAQLNKLGGIIKIFCGVRVACRETGINHKSIAAVAGGSNIRKSAGGFKWLYT